MLSQLEFKLTVERQYKDGIDKIIGSYRMEGDNRIRAEANGRRMESIQKIQLLQRALKRYEDLHVDLDTSVDGTDDDSLNTPNLRKTLTGQLSIRIQAIGDVEHIVAGRWSKKIDTFVQIKVEDELKAKTKNTRTDRWTDENHEIAIDKGNEVELTVYDRPGSDAPMPIGMLWVRISDIVEEMRKKKIETELHNSGWVSAGQVEDSSMPRPDIQFKPPPGSSGASPNHFAGPNYTQSGGGLGPQPQTGPVVLDGWYSLEPVGKIFLSMSFGESRGRALVKANNTDMPQPSKPESESHSMLVSDVVALSDNARKTSMSNTVINSSLSSFTTSCAVLSAASCSSTRSAISALTASICAMRNALLWWLPSVSADLLPKATQTRRRSITRFHIAGSLTTISARTGVATAATCCHWARKTRRDAKVRWIKAITESPIR